jgi:hypothetical protein
LREFSKFRDFSENLSVLFPSALATIAEGGSRRGYQMYFSVFVTGIPVTNGIFIVIHPVARNLTHDFYGNWEMNL